MKKSMSLAAAALIMVLLSASSCAMTADLFLVQKASREEKAQVLADRGVELYNVRLVQNEDFGAVSLVRAHFTNALILDPLNETARKYLARTNAWKAERLAFYVAKAKGYRVKKNRNERDDYEYCGAVERAVAIEGSNKDALAMRKETEPLRAKLLEKRVTPLKETEKRLVAEKRRTEGGKLATQAAKLATEILYLDSKNGDALRVRKEIADKARAWVSDDLAKAKTATEKKDYAGAETVIRNAERALADAGQTTTPELRDAKYRLYYRWAQDLFAAKKYDEADAKASSALAVSRTADAAALKSKAQEEASRRDFDAEIDAVLADIDALIRKGDLAGAIRTIDIARDNMKVQANKDRVAAKRSDVMERVKAVYGKAVEDYNAELYKEARDGFTVVLRVAPDYEQAKAYYDKADAKIKALGGE
ncbi:MAG: hypothetical protein NT080_07580 [Spirochaetes bacterium]|nr:hypothetical protein [Spirochaetota bacterium]